MVFVRPKLSSVDGDEAMDSRFILTDGFIFSGIDTNNIVLIFYGARVSQKQRHLLKPFNY